MNIEEVRNKNIPTSSGCYKFLDSSGKIIYVGKAINLRSRVFSYWLKSTSHSPAKKSMMSKIVEINWIKTDSEIEALLLEANLIKKLQPQYNIVMRDDKRFVYIKITNEDYPRVFMTRKIDKNGRYFGPFISSEAVRETLKAIRKVWPFRTCVRMPSKACLYYRIGKCSAPCEEKINKKDYKKIIKQIVLFFEGKKEKIIKDIESDIKSLEKKGLVEKEIFFLEKRLKNLKEVFENSRVLSLSNKYSADVVELAKVLGFKKIPKKIEGYDISNIFGSEAVGSMVVFIDGESSKADYKKFKIKAKEKKGDTEMMEEILERRLKRSDDDWSFPDLIIIDGGKGQLNSVLKIFRKMKINIPVISVSKGEGLRSSIAQDKIFFPGEKKPLELSLNSPAMHIVKRVRDEAHRFAINYHRKLKRKKIFK